MRDDQIGVLLEQQSLPDQQIGSLRDLGDIVGMGRITLSEGRARVADGVAVGLRLKERDEGSRQVAGIPLTEPGLADIPPGIGSERHLHVGVAQTVDIISVDGIDLGASAA